MEEKVSILLVEDEPKIRSGLRDFLEYHDYQVTEAADGEQADTLVKAQQYDLILLDLMLPKISGEELCQKWRQRGVHTAIIMVTAKGQEKEKISGLGLGADDYVTKPFSLEELRARIEAVLRRTRPERTVGQRFAFGPWQVDAESLKAQCDNREIEISKREAQLIQCFAANPNRILSREELYNTVWGEKMTELGTRTVDMHIAKLRSKIEPDGDEPTLIKTVRGAGYVYEKVES